MINSQGIILTNYHVVKGYDTVTVTIEDRHRTKGTVMAYDDGLDLAMVKIEAGSWTFVPISFDRPSVGDEIFAIGYPLGFNLVGESTVTRGSVSAFRPRSRHTMIQTDAAINPGNSGGAAFTSDGRFIGVPTSKFMGADNLGFLIGLFSVSGDITRLMDFRTEYRLYINGIEVGQNTRMNVSAGTVMVSQSPRSDGTYKLNTSVTLTASAPPGLQITWSGIDREDNQFATVKMNADRFVTVKMRPPTATITPSPTPTPTPGPIDRQQPSGYIPRLDATVLGVRFYESGYDHVALDDREYRVYFDGSTARYISWELDLDYPSSPIKRDFAIEWVLYRVGQNKYLFRETADTFAGVGWSGSYHNSGWGSNTPGRIYKPGAYYINCFVDGDLIAKGEFEVY